MSSYAPSRSAYRASFLSLTQGQHHQPVPPVRRQPSAVWQHCAPALIPSTSVLLLPWPVPTEAAWAQGGSCSEEGKQQYSGGSLAPGLGREHEEVGLKISCPNSSSGKAGPRQIVVDNCHEFKMLAQASGKQNYLCTTCPFLLLQWPFCEQI